jgi:glycosyltransferase involved in cell wall biosynthesis
MRVNSATAALRIAHLIESDGPGGAEQVVVHLATSLQASGAQSVVFVPANGEGWLARQLEGSGVAVEYFDLNRPLSPACARQVAAALRRHDVQIAHSHEFSMAVYGAWASWLAGIPHVITMHGGRYYADRLRRRLALGLSVTLSERTIAVSSQLAGDLRRDLIAPASRISMIPNGVRSSRTELPTLRAELRLRADDRLLVSIGNLYPVKGHEYLLEAIARLNDRHAHLAIAGRGLLAETLAARARDLGIGDRVHLLGLRSDVSAVLAAADIFVLPSLSEGLPLALLEAMFAGCPIVASDVGEIGRALDDGAAGLLVPPGDAPALAAALNSLLGHPAQARELGERAARRAAVEYDVTQMVRRYTAVYEEALTPRRAAQPAAAEISLGK